MWSFNSLVRAWEPVLEPWKLIINGDMNTGQSVRAVAPFSTSPLPSTWPACLLVTLVSQTWSFQSGPCTAWHSACHKTSAVLNRAVGCV